VKTYDELREVVAGALGKFDLMEFLRLNLGFVQQLEQGFRAPKSARYLVGNPIIMEQMLKHVADAGAYAPVTVLINERPDGVHLSYDKMSGYLARYGNAEASRIAQDLDAKVETLLRTAAT
jgi:hypothetical protein